MVSNYRFFMRLLFFSSCDLLMLSAALNVFFTLFTHGKDGRFCSCDWRKSSPFEELASGKSTSVPTSFGLGSMFLSWARRYFDYLWNPCRVLNLRSISTCIECFRWASLEVSFYGDGLMSITVSRSTVDTGDWTSDWYSIWPFILARAAKVLVTTLSKPSPASPCYVCRLTAAPARGCTNMLDLFY